jgi:hypothetical protein
LANALLKVAEVDYLVKANYNGDSKEQAILKLLPEKSNQLCC